jgi:hypothetical protein
MAPQTRAWEQTERKRKKNCLQISAVLIFAAKFLARQLKLEIGFLREQGLYNMER